MSLGEKSLTGTIIQVTVHALEPLSALSSAPSFASRAAIWYKKNALEFAATALRVHGNERVMLGVSRSPLTSKSLIKKWHQKVGHIYVSNK